MSEPARSIAGGIALMVIGLLILVPSGLCVGWFGIGALLEILTEPSHGNDALGLLGLALMFGGPVVAVGAVLVWLAVRLMRRK